MAWVLRDYPSPPNTGSRRWLSSLLSSAQSAGLSNAVVLVTARGLPLVTRILPGSVDVRSPHLLSIGRLRVARPKAAGQRLSWTVYLRLPQPVQHLIARGRRAWRKRRAADHVLGRAWSPREHRWLSTALDLLSPSVVVFDSPFTLVPPPGAARTVLLLHDLVHERAASFAALGLSTVPAGITEQWESERIASMDALVAIQWDDAKTVKTMAPGAAVVVAPPTFRPTLAPPGDGGQARRTCLFVGHGTAHNVDGLRWMLDQVWARVQSVLPDAELRIVGTVCGQIGRPTRGVHLIGEVGDVTPEYLRTSLVLAPVRAGSGLKVKLIEGICHGRASVTTTVGAQGLGHLEPRPFLVADTAADFADAIVKVLANDESRVQLEQAAADASRAFDPVRAHAELIDLLSSLGGT